MKKIVSLALAIVASLPVFTSSAATLDDIQFWVGSGANSAGLVIDWNDGKTAESLAWGYRWDGSATGLDMLQAIVAADPRLFANVSPSGQFGVSIYGLGYDLNGSGGFGTTPALGFDGGGWVVGTPDDSRTPVDPNDHWKEGWFSGFWGYDVRTTSFDPWGFSNEGPADRILSDGVWDGYSFAPEFNFSNPSEPVMAVIPEPTMFALGLTSGVMILLRRKNR